MDAIPEDRILRFHSDTMQTLRKMYNLEKPGDMDFAITALQDWLKKQHHFSRKNYPRPYLERLIILQKGSLQRAKAQIENICAMRTLLPEYFEVNNQEITDQHIFHAGFIPTLTEDNYRILAVKFCSQEMNAKIFFQIYKYAIFMAEYCMLKDYCNGLICVLDYSDINIMNYIAVVNVLELYRMIKIVTSGYALRIKQIHVITPSTAANSFINLVKKMFSAKVANRFYVHRTIQHLYEFLPKDILPLEYGGNGSSLAGLRKEWIDELQSEKIKQHLIEMSEAKSTEAYKMKDSVNDSDLGISGSFRALNVD